MTAKKKSANKRATKATTRATSRVRPAATAPPASSLLSIAVGPRSVSLCFYSGARLPGPHEILHGGGNQVGFYRVDGPKALETPPLLAMIRAANAHGRVPLARAGKGHLIIKAISASSARDDPLPNRAEREHASRFPLPSQAGAPKTTTARDRADHHAPPIRITP